MIIIPLILLNGLSASVQALSLMGPPLVEKQTSTIMSVMTTW